MAMVPEAENRGEIGVKPTCRFDVGAILTSGTSLDVIRCLNDRRGGALSFLPDLDLHATASSGDSVRTTPNSAEREKLVDKAVGELHLPESWRAHPGQTEDQRLLAYGLTSMTVQLLGDIDAMDKLHNTPTFGAAFPFELPKGVSVERDDSGRITNINLGMPSDLSKIDGTDVAHLHDLNSWLKTYQPKIEQITEQLGRIAGALEPPIEEGDIPVSGGQASKRSTNQLSVNLIQERFTVGDDLLEPGNINVEQTSQEQHVPWYGYQNSFAENIGAPTTTGHSFKPDDYAVVERDGVLNLVQSKFLGVYKDLEDTRRKSNNESSVTMDLGLALTGGAEVGLAWRSGEAAFAEGARFLRLFGGREGAIAAGSAKALIGAAGVLNNAGVNQTRTGREFNKLRGMLFVLEAGASLATSGAAKLGFKLPSSESAFESAALNNPGLGLVRTAGSISFGLGIPVGGGLVSSQLMEQVSQFAAPDYAQEALDAYSKGQELPRTGQH
jgi:hypothetical protein